jgi:phosphomannomutase/phosphoglucomutase
MEIKDKIFRQYDIRGVVGEDLDGEVAYLIGRAFASFLKEVRPSAAQVSVGRDVRLSSDELAEGVIRGIRASGLDVRDIGVCPTPLQYFSLFHLDLDGGIMVTGSHNPPEYNGLKLSAGKETLYGEAIQRIKKIVKTQAGQDRGRGQEKAGKLSYYEIIPAYRKYMLDEFGPLMSQGSRSRKLKVVIDAGNGTAGLVVPDLLNRLGCEVFPLYCEPDGRFPHHHPDPTVVECIRDLIITTKETGADLGVGYDGDADRIGVVDGGGNVIWGDQLMVILARDILDRSPGAKIIGDVKCSQVMFDDVKARGGEPIMWKTGHSLVKKKMRDENALLAGEFSGHIFIAERYFGYDDAIYTTLRLIEILTRTGKDLGTLLEGIPRMYYTPEIRMDCADDLKGKVVDGVIRRFVDLRENGGSPYPIKDVNTIDGVRVVFEKGWGLVRVSNTQPVIVMRFEATDQESLNNYREFIEAEIEKIEISS